MNKTNSSSSKRMTKVAVASALGLALLAGGGTFALWSAESAANTGASITAGDLNVTASEVQNWFDVTDAAKPVAIPSLADYSLAPGNTIKLTQTINAVVDGDNMTGILNVQVPNTTTGAALTQGVYTVTVKDGAKVLATSQAGGIGSDGTLRATVVDLPSTGPDGKPLNIEVTVGLPLSADNATKLQTISLSDMQITLDQGPALAASPAA